MFLYARSLKETFADRTAHVLNIFSYSIHMDLRIIYSLQSAVLFFIVASPFMYRLTGKLFGTKGTGAIVLHSAVFGVLVYLLMLINAR
jgi:hypothetical protein